MKLKLAVLILLAAIGAFSCGNDAGEGRVELALSTDDGIENLGSIVPPDPQYASTPTWLDSLQVLAYAGNPESGMLLMDETYPARTIVSGEYLPVEVPAGRDAYFIINALDTNHVIHYSGTAGPVNIEPNTTIALNVEMQKMIVVPDPSLSLTLNLTLAADKSDFDSSLVKFGISGGKVSAHIYTKAVRIGDQWVPTNPDDGFDYSVGGSYYSSQWTGGTFLSNMFQLITVHAEDDEGGVVFYGVRLFNKSWYGSTPSNLDVYMYHPSKLVVTLVGSNLPLSATIQMYVNGGWRDLSLTNTTIPTFNATTTNPVVVDAPSSAGWLSSSAPVQTRQVRVHTGVGSWGSTATVEVEWGVNTVTITGP